MPRSDRGGWMRRLLIVLAAAGCWVVAWPAAAPAQVDAPSDGPSGLDALDDGRVLSQITEIGLEDLLRHALAERGVAAADAEVFLANIALARLTGDVPLPADERQAVVRDVLAGVDELVARQVSQREGGQLAGLMLQRAGVLIDRGISEDVRLLEYFGDNPQRRAFVGDVATGVGRLLERSAELFDAEARRLGALVERAGQPEQAQAAEAQRQAQQARSLIAFADYYRVLGSEPQSPGRINLAEDVATRLAPLDTERNPNRAFVRLMLGRVNLARGNRQGYERARDFFETAVASGDDPSRVFDAYFGRVVSEASLGDAEAARQQLQRFESWYAGQDAAALPGRDPLMLVTAYRVAAALAEGATSESARTEADAEATRLLVRLVEDYEDYRPVVTGQLLARSGDGGDGELADLTPLVLDAVVDRGRVEAARRASGEASDEDVIRRGIAAARELARRSGSGDDAVSPQAVASNAFLAALMTRTLGEDLEAAELFVGYAALPAADRGRRETALRQALALADETRRGAEPTGEVALRADAVEARVLPELVDGFGDRTLAFDLANRLHRAGELDAAAGYYASVPSDDPRLADAERLRFLALAERVSVSDASDPTYRERLSDAVAQGERAVSAVNDAAASAETPATRDAFRARAAETRVAVARLSLNELGDPARATQALADLEDAVAGAPDAQAILDDALPLRFQAQALAGDVDGATRDLLTLLETSDPIRGFRFIEQFREALGRAYDAAVRRGDDEQRRRLTLTRAAVTPRLVTWIEGTDGAYRRYAYTFRVLDAETQYQAAREETDSSARDERLRLALTRFRELGEAQNVRQFRQLVEGLTDAQREQVAYDPGVLLNQGRILADLGEHDAARGLFGRLLSDRTLGDPTRRVTVDGVTRVEPNLDFWEAQLRFIESNLRHDPETRGAMTRLLRRLDALHGEAVGGTRFASDFARLREELAAS